MRIGVIIGRIGGVDGVALETLKWLQRLTRKGHLVFIISGEFNSWRMIQPYDYLFPILSFFSAEAEWEQRKAFFEPDKSPEPLLEHLENASELIYKKLDEWYTFNNLDCLLSENASALACHLSMGIGIKKFAERSGVPVITHDHDFHWERGDRYKSVHPEVNKLVSATFPLILPNVSHAVINTYIQDSFKECFNTDALLVPNVMDFSRPYGIPTKENELVMRRIGVAKDEKAILQVTRIVRRKGIETAISLMEKLNDKKLKLVITGNHHDDENNIYYNELVDQILDLKLMNQVIFASDNVSTHLDLSDVYAQGTACTYFSTYEGFGNGFIEAILAKKPIFVNNYKPVYMPDIGSKGFKTVMIEENTLTDESVKQMAEIIYNPKLAKEIGEYNFEIGRKYFSYKILDEKLDELFSFVKVKKT